MLFAQLIGQHEDETSYRMQLFKHPAYSTSTKPFMTPRRVHSSSGMGVYRLSWKHCRARATILRLSHSHKSWRARKSDEIPRDVFMQWSVVTSGQACDRTKIPSMAKSAVNMNATLCRKTRHNITTSIYEIRVVEISTFLGRGIFRIMHRTRKSRGPYSALFSNIAASHRAGCPICMMCWEFFQVYKKGCLLLSFGIFHRSSTFTRLVSMV